MPSKHSALMSEAKCANARSKISVLMLKHQPIVSIKENNYNACTYASYTIEIYAQKHRNVLN